MELSVEPSTLSAENTDSEEILKTLSSVHITTDQDAKDTSAVNVTMDDIINETIEETIVDDAVNTSPDIPIETAATDPVAEPFAPQQENVDDSSQKEGVLATFNKTVGDLINELKGTFPELKESLDERYTTISPEDVSFLQWFEINAHPHFLAITTKDEKLFKNNDTTFLLPDINFSQLWKCKLTKATKAAIWKYLHVLLLLVSHYQLNTHDFESTFSQWNEMLDKTNMDETEMENMKVHADQIMQLMQNLTGGDDDDEDDDDDNKEQNGSPDNDTTPNNKDAGGTQTPEEKAKQFEDELKQDPFIKQLENSKIAQFAKELSSEIDIGSLGLNPDAKVESFQDVFGMIGKNPQRLLGLVKSVGDKIQNKMSSGDIKQSELVEEAHTLVKTMQDSKAFKKMFKKARKKGKKGGLDPQTLFATMAKQMGNMPGMPPGGGAGMDPEAMQKMMAQMMGSMGGMAGGGGGGPGQTLARMNTQERLRSKLNDKSSGGGIPASLDATPPPPPQHPPVAPTGTSNKKRRKKKKKKPPQVST